eukprot:gene12757-biopygen3045
MAAQNGGMSAQNDGMAAQLGGKAATGGMAARFSARLGFFYHGIGCGKNLAETSLVAQARGRAKSRPVSPRLAGEPRLAKGSPKARQGSPEARQG